MRWRRGAHGAAALLAFLLRCGSEWAWAASKVDTYRNSTTDSGTTITSGGALLPRRTAVSTELPSTHGVTESDAVLQRRARIARVAFLKMHLFGLDSPYSGASQEVLMNSTEVWDSPQMSLAEVRLVDGRTMPACDLIMLCTLSEQPQPRTYLLYSTVMLLYLMPFIGLFGLFGNALSAFVYSRRVMRSSTNLYLCALAVSDLSIILTAQMLFVMEGARRHSLGISIIYPPVSLYVWPVSQVAQSCSVFYTVAAGVDCFTLIVLPARISAKVCRNSVALIAIPSIAVFAVVYNVPHLFEVTSKECFNMAFDAVSNQVCPTEFRFDEDYNRIYYTYLYTLIMVVGPLVALIVMNVSIITVSMLNKRRKLLAERKRTLASQNCDGANAQPEEQEEDDSITLVLVVCLFICCNSLALVINILETTGMKSFLRIMSYFVDASNLLVVTNSSLNFIIYYAFGESFRRTLRSYFCQSERAEAACRNSSGKARGLPAKNDARQPLLTAQRNGGDAAAPATAVPQGRANAASQTDTPVEKRNGGAPNDDAASPGSSSHVYANCDAAAGDRGNHVADGHAQMPRANSDSVQGRKPHPNCSQRPQSLVFHENSEFPIITQV